MIGFLGGREMVVVLLNWKWASCFCVEGVFLCEKVVGMGFEDLLECWLVPILPRHLIVCIIVRLDSGERHLH